MKAYLQVPSEVIPLIRLDPEKNIFEISGRSIPVDADKVFCNVLEWFDGFIKESHKSVKFLIKLEFFNLASSKRLLLILFKLRKMKMAGTRVVIHWVYAAGDKDMLEIGQDYASLVEEIEFQFDAQNSSEYIHDQNRRYG